MSIFQLRALIRIEESRLAFYQQTVDHASEDSTEAGMATARALTERWQLCVQRLQLRRSYLAARLSPAASSLVNASLSSGAVQSGYLATS